MKTSFTIIELIFVIVIIGVLAAIALPRYEEVQDDALLQLRKQLLVKQDTQFYLFMDGDFCIQETEIKL